MGSLLHRNNLFFKIIFLTNMAFLFLVVMGCVSIQHKNYYNHYFMPYDAEKIAETQPYNCLFVKGILGDKSKILIYLEPRQKDPPFLIVHEKIDLKDNDLYNLTKGQPIFIPFQVCNDTRISSGDEGQGVTAYSLSFLDAWVYDLKGEKVKIKDTNFWQTLKDENDIDEIQAYLTIKDEPDSFLDNIRYIFTLSFGSKDATKQIHLRFKPRIMTLIEDRPKCKP